MLRRVVKFSLDFRGVVIALACVLIGYGIYVAANAKLDVFPEFVQPQVTVQTEAPGLAAEQVEAIVTRPVESALNGAGNLESIRSESIQGLSVVTVVFREGTDIFIARQMLAERLSELAGELPLDIKAPKMSPLTSSTMDLLKFGLLSEKLSPMALRTFADWTVRPRLLSVPGVAKVSVFGGEVRQLQIQVKPEALTAFNLTIQDVLAAAREATGVRGGGFVETPSQRIVIQSEGQSTTAKAMRQIVVAIRDSRNIRLGDLADVVEAPAPKFGDALIMGKPGLLLTMSGQFAANTMEVTEAVEQALEELKPTFDKEGIIYIPGLHRPATFIETAIKNVKTSLLLGAALVAIVLFLFLLDLRTAFISFTAIPLSLLTAVIVLDRFGVTINTITLGGFAVAIGVVVDDAIIDVENILRRLRENLTIPNPHSVFEVILEASLEVRSAIVYASFIVALVFLPVLTMTGLQGRFFAPLGIAFILATLASLLVALTVTPALCYVLLGRAKPHQEPKYLVRLKKLHQRVLAKIIAWPRTVILAGMLMFGAALAMLPFLGGEFLPEFREGHFVLQVSTIPGTSLIEMRRLGQLISHELLKNPQIKTIEQQIGRAEMGEDTWGPNQSEFHVELKPSAGAVQAKVQDEIRATLAAIPGIQSEVLTFLGDRIGESISGETAQVVVNVFGDDLDLLDRKAHEISEVLSSIPGAADVQVKSPPGTPGVSVTLRPERLTELGFRPLEVLTALQTAYQGAVVAQTYEGSKVFDVAVILAPGHRRDAEVIGQMIIRNAAGLRVPLRAVADIEFKPSRYAILHDGARRRQTITCNPNRRDVTSFVHEARQRIAASVQLPSGVYLTYSGAAEEQARAQREILLHSLLAAAGILLLLAIVFRNWRNLLLVCANLPFALVGGVLALFVVGRFGDKDSGGISLGTLVGFVTLFGITMRNSIMMISHFEHLVRQEGMVWDLKAVIRGSDERLVPILMTALVTALGVLPLALGSGEAGREIEGGMAIVILGGLITSTALNLLVLPMLALKFGRFSPAPSISSR